MKKVAIIYYSNSGHVESMAEAVSKGVEGAGGQVVIKRVNEARVNDVLDCDFVFFGSPSMDGNKIEALEMEPFVAEFKLIPVEKKKCILFGSYGWDDGEFMKSWTDRMIDYDFDVIKTYVVKETPNEKQLKECEKMGSSAIKE